MERFNCVIVGGGLAGLALSIQLVEQGHSVLLFEKEKYPFHRVCGEYISLESWDFLCSLGLSLKNLNLPRIKKLNLSSPNGNMLHHVLKPGGFGISRFTLDYLLAEIAESKGVEIIQTKVNDIHFSESKFYINTQLGDYSADLAFGAFGKRSNLDVKMQRDFVQNSYNPKNNYIGVKYHIRLPFPDDLIELHNFRNGYCGISKVEGDKYCLCYLTTAQNLRNHHNDIKKLEIEVLMKNHHLKKYFSEATFLNEQPLVISQISFAPKQPVENHMIMLGDAAGLITPLCGNGMSMALHASKIAATKVQQLKQKQINFDELGKSYKIEWRKNFENRLLTGRILQNVFGHPTLTDIAINSLNYAPNLVNSIVKYTHGKNF